MYYNPLTKEEEFHELVKEIESQSAYKRVPSPEKKYMSVAEMGLCGYIRESHCGEPGFYLCR